MTAELVDDLFQSEALVVEMSDDAMKKIAARSCGGAISDDVVVINLRRLWAGVSAVVAREQALKKIIERRQLAAVADFQPADRDVARGVAVELDACAGLAIEGELALDFGAGGAAE